MNPAMLVRPLRRLAARCLQWWIDSPTVNKLRRKWHHWRVSLTGYGRPDGCLRLHLGCGRQRLDGFINIDFRRTSATDLVLDVVSLPFADGVAERIETYHLIEHLSAAAARSALREWRRVLTPGGQLIIECPDFDQACREYLAGDSSRLADIFGAQRFEGDFHLYGYSARRLMTLLQQGGFVNVRSEDACDYHTQWGPCLRIEARRPVDEPMDCRGSVPPLCQKAG